MTYRILFLFIILTLYSCNPVKQVLNNKEKFDQVASEVIRRGYCVNDTIVVNQVKDSIVYRDSQFNDSLKILPANMLREIDTMLSTGIRIRIHGDIIRVTGAVKSSTIYKTVEKNSYIRDLSRENLLKTDNDSLQAKILRKSEMINDRQAQINTLNARVRTFQLRFWGMLALVSAITILRLYFRKLSPL